MPAPCSNAQKIHPASGCRMQITTQQELPLRRLPSKWLINPHIVKMAEYLMSYNQKNVCEVPLLPARLGERRRDTWSSFFKKKKKRYRDLGINSESQLWSISTQYKEDKRKPTKMHHIQCIESFYYYLYSWHWFEIGKYFTEVQSTYALHFPYYKSKFHSKFKFYWSTNPEI